MFNKGDVVVTKSGRVAIITYKDVLKRLTLLYTDGLCVVTDGEIIDKVVASHSRLNPAFRLFLNYVDS